MGIRNVGRMKIMNHKEQEKTIKCTSIYDKKRFKGLIIFIKIKKEKKKFKLGSIFI